MDRHDILVCYSRRSHEEPTREVSEWEMSPKPLLFWTGTGQFPRETIWEGHEERETWERNNR
jgi:hypothetical protein